MFKTTKRVNPEAIQQQKPQYSNRDMMFSAHVSDTVVNGMSPEERVKYLFFLSNQEQKVSKYIFSPNAAKKSADQQEPAAKLHTTGRLRGGYSTF